MVGRGKKSPFANGIFGRCGQCVGAAEGLNVADFAEEINCRLYADAAFNPEALGDFSVDGWDARFDRPGACCACRDRQGHYQRKSSRLN